MKIFINKYLKNYFNVELGDFRTEVGHIFYINKRDFGKIKMKQKVNFKGEDFEYFYIIDSPIIQINSSVIDLEKERITKGYMYLNMKY